MLDVTALGEILIDFTPCGDVDGVRVFAQNPGGAPLNVLAQNALLGGKTAFIGKVGADGFGDDLREVMLNNNINTQGLVISEEVHTTLAFVQLDNQGERSFVFYRNPGADILLKKEELATDLIQNSHFFILARCLLRRSHQEVLPMRRYALQKMQVALLAMILTIGNRCGARKQKQWRACWRSCHMQTS
jgi:fructokinase